MAEVDFVIMADYVRADSGVLNIVGGGFDRITVDQLPYAQNVGLGIRMLFTRPECASPHHLRIIFQDAQAQQLVEIGGEFTVVEHRDFEPGDLITGVVNANLGVVFPQHGRYSFEILLDGEHKKSIGLRVVPPPAG